VVLADPALLSLISVLVCAACSYKGCFRWNMNGTTTVDSLFIVDTGRRGLDVFGPTFLKELAEFIKAGSKGRSGTSVYSACHDPQVVLHMMQDLTFPSDGERKD